MTSEEIKQALTNMENEQLQVEKTFRKIVEEEENDLQDIKQQLAQINEKQQRWQQDPQLTDLLHEEETVLVERYNHQHQFLEDITEKRKSYKKQLYQTVDELGEQLKQEQLTNNREAPDGITS